MSGGVEAKVQPRSSQGHFPLSPPPPNSFSHAIRYQPQGKLQIFGTLGLTCFGLVVASTNRKICVSKMNASV